MRSWALSMLVRCEALKTRLGSGMGMPNVRSWARIKMIGRTNDGEAMLVL